MVVGLASDVAPEVLTTYAELMDLRVDTDSDRNVDIPRSALDQDVGVGHDPSFDLDLGQDLKLEPGY